MAPDAPHTGWLSVIAHDPAAVQQIPLQGCPDEQDTVQARVRRSHA
jgi:hypothetical protein